MRFFVYSVQQHGNPLPVYDQQGKQVGTEDVTMLEVVAIPHGERAEAASCRLHVQFFRPDDATKLRYNHGTIFEADGITSEAGEQANAALDAAKAAAAAQAEKPAMN